MVAAGRSRRALARTLNEAFAGGLMSEHTFTGRLDHVLRDRIIDTQLIVGDLQPGAPGGMLLALDWNAGDEELLVGRSRRCDVVITDESVSRMHARLRCRDGRWVLLDLESTNGTEVNGRRVGRCELRPGDVLSLGGAGLRVD